MWFLTNPGIYARDLMLSEESGFSPSYEQVGLKPGFFSVFVAPSINAGVSQFHTACTVNGNFKFVDFY
jgi:hypothetical protein